jgi:tRNA G10  N-methylase Trm11
MLYCDEFQNILPTLEEESISTVVADPPYAREFSYLYSDLAHLTPRVLEDGGSLLAILPHYNIPEIVSEIGRHLKWRWMISMWQDQGPHPRMSMGIEIIWKPIGWWVKRAWPHGRGFKRDGFYNAPPPKLLHPWEQSMNWAIAMLSFVPEGGTVLDPMMGIGTMGIACKKAGVNFIGIENDEETFTLAQEAIENTPVPA